MPNGTAIGAGSLGTASKRRREKKFTTNNAGRRERRDSITSVEVHELLNQWGRHDSTKPIRS